MAAPAREAASRLPRPVWLLGWVSFVTDTATEMIYPLLPLFLTRVLGAGAMSLGVIEGVAEAANSVLKIAAGRLADRTGAPKPIVIAGYAISGAVRPLIALVTSWTQVLGCASPIASARASAARRATRCSRTSRPPHIRGRVYGFHRAMDNAGAVLGPLLASVFLFFHPEQYRTLFALTIIPGIIVVLILLRVPDAMNLRPEPEPSEPPEPPEPLEPAEPSEPTTTLLDPCFASDLPLQPGNASDAFLLLRLNDLGIAAFWIPLLWSGLHVVKVVVVARRRRPVRPLRTPDADRRRLADVRRSSTPAFGFVDSPAAVDRDLSDLRPLLRPDRRRGEGVGRRPRAGARRAAPRSAIYNAALGVGGLVASLLFGVIWTRVSPQRRVLDRRRAGRRRDGAAILAVFP